MVDREIKNYGLTNVLKGMASAPEQLIRLAQDIVYYELDSQKRHEALQAFSQIIRGGIVMSKRESMEENEVLDGINNES